MIRITALFGLLALAPFLLGLTVTDTVTPGRIVDGNVVSDREVEVVVPNTGNVQGTGSTTISWAEVTTNANGAAITVKNYEVRFRLVGGTVYTLIVVPPEFTGHALTLPAGDYEGYVQAIDLNGYISTAGTFTFTIN